MEIYSISLFFVLCYLILIARYCIAWHRTPQHNTSDTKTNIGISVVIPARNEGQYLLSCLEAISKQKLQHNRFEVLVIDDHSEDATKDIAQQFFSNHQTINGKVLSLTEIGVSGKKEAITYGMHTAKHPLVVTTDADCVSSPTWLTSILSYYEKHGGKLIAAPVLFKPSSTLSQMLQDLELIGLQAVGAAGIAMDTPVLCNGANLCYDRDAFLMVGGYGDNSAILSGDDLFILQKINKKYPGEVRFIKSRDATVQSVANSSAFQFFNQRKRWVSKVISIPDWRTIVVAFIVYLTNLLLLINFIFWLVLPDFSGSFLIITFGAKALIDFLFLHLATSFFRRKMLMRIFLLAEPLNVIYVAVIGLWGNIGKYNWKGRTSGQRSFVSNNS